MSCQASLHRASEHLIIYTRAPILNSPYCFESGGTGNKSIGSNNVRKTEIQWIWWPQRRPKRNDEGKMLRLRSRDPGAFQADRGQAGILQGLLSEAQARNTHGQVLRPVRPKLFHLIHLNFYLIIHSFYNPAPSLAESLDGAVGTSGTLGTVTMKQSVLASAWIRALITRLSIAMWKVSSSSILT